MSTANTVIHSIKKAFSRSATSLKSCVFFDGKSDGCIKDLIPSNDEILDKLLSIDKIFPPPRLLYDDEGKVEKREGAKDEVIIIGAGGDKLDVDRVLVLGGGGDEEEGRNWVSVIREAAPLMENYFPRKKNDYASDDDLDEDDEKKEGSILIDVLI